jgi:hypothetical protein
MITSRKRNQLLDCSVFGFGCFFRRFLIANISGHQDVEWWEFAPILIQFGQRRQVNVIAHIVDRPTRADRYVENNFIPIY